MMAGEQAQGTISQWNPRGFGFAELADGRRAYVHSSQFGGGDLFVGETVSFTIIQDAKNPGKWAAHHVQRMSDDPGRMEGVVVQWNPRGFGFVQTVDGRRAYVHASQFQGENLTEGEHVTAVISEDAQNPGKWAATDVQRSGEVSQQATQTFDGGSGYGAWATGANHRSSPYDQMAASMDGGAADPQWGFADAALSDEWGLAGEVSGERAEGDIVEWNERGFGFMQTQDGRKVYVHHSSFGGGNLVPGVTVNAIVQQDQVNPGKWAASDVKLGKLAKPHLQQRKPAAARPAPVAYGQAVARQAMPVVRHQPAPVMQFAQPIVKPIVQPVAYAQPAAPAVASGYSETGRAQGIVTQWNERGFGFVEANGVRAYVHTSSFGGGDLVQGEIVNFILEEDPKNPGKWCAKHVIRGPLEEGTVESWNETGFGFIRLDDGRRAYIHASVAGGDLQVGMRLHIVSRPDPKNPGKICVGEIKAILSPAAVDGVPMA